MCKVSLRKTVVGLNDARHVVSVNANGNTHQHVLRTFGNLVLHLEQVRLF
jgi:hypothetical protein